MHAETQRGRDEAPMPDAFGTFLRALDRTLEEVRTRSPEYFEQHALRTTLPRGPEADAVGDLICDAYDVEILFGADPSSLSAVDRLFESRLGINCRNPSAGFLEAVDEDGIAARLAAWTRQRAEARRAERARMAGFPGPDTLRSLPRDGSLQYHVFGDAGPTVVVVNAIGMGLEYWARLVDRLVPGHRVVLWSLRTLDGEGRVATLDDQVGDIAAIVDEVAAGPVHLVGWCSGPKL